MRNSFGVMVILIAAITGLHAMKLMGGGTITGKLSPSSAVSQAWVVTQKNAKKILLRDSVFLLPLKEGQYTVVVEAKQPYKSIVKKNIVVKNGETTNIGIITLE